MADQIQGEKENQVVGALQWLYMRDASTLLDDARTDAFTKRAEITPSATGGASLNITSEANQTSSFETKATQEVKSRELRQGGPTVVEGTKSVSVFAGDNAFQQSGYDLEATAFRGLTLMGALGAPSGIHGTEALKDATGKTVRSIVSDCTNYEAVRTCNAEVRDTEGNTIGFMKQSSHFNPEARAWDLKNDIFSMQGLVGTLASRVEQNPSGYVIENKFNKSNER